MTSILYTIRSLDIGGAERQLVTQALGMRDRGFRVSVATFYPGGPFAGELERGGISVRSLDKQSRMDIAGFSLRFVRFVRDENPDVVYSFMTGANVVTAALKPLWGRRRLIWGVRSSDTDTGANRRQLQLAITASVYLSSRPDAIVANSAAGAAHHIRLGYPAGRVRVVPNGIDTERFNLGAGSGRYRAQWQIAPGEHAVGLVARLNPIKDHTTFFRAIGLLTAWGHRVRAVCVGAGPASYQAHLRAVASDAGLADRVEWIAETPDMPDLYRSLDVAVSASSSEGFSNSVAEAMACGVPCVVTDVGDSAAIVGPNGRLVPPRDPSAMAHAIADTLSAQTAAAQAACRARIVDDFGIPRMLDRTEQLIHDLA